MVPLRPRSRAWITLLDAALIACAAAAIVVVLGGRTRRAIPAIPNRRRWRASGRGARALRRHRGPSARLPPLRRGRGPRVAALAHAEPAAPAPRARPRRSRVLGLAPGALHPSARQRPAAPVRRQHLLPGRGHAHLLGCDGAAVADGGAVPARRGGPAAGVEPARAPRLSAERA